MYQYSSLHTSTLQWKNPSHLYKRTPNKNHSRTKLYICPDVIYCSAKMSFLNFISTLWRKSLRLIIFAIRIQAVIISYIVTSIACVLYGKDAVNDSQETEKVEELYEPSNDYLEKIDENSEGENERYIYVDTAIIAVDQFWSKAEDKVWEMAKRRVPIDTKMLLLDAIQESYNKLKYKLRDDLRGQGVNLEERFEPLLAERNTKLAELRFLLMHSENREDIHDENPPFSVDESFEGQIESLTNVLSSADTLAKRPASSVHDMIPVLRDVQREVSEMLKYLEGVRPNFDPKLLKELSAEYQYESARF